MQQAIGFAEDGLDDAFVQEIKKCLGLADSLEPAYFAMDYHLDWLYAALHFTEKNFKIKQSDCRVPAKLLEIERERHRDRLTQEDADLLVVFTELDSTRPLKKQIHLVLFEAKYDGAYSNPQFKSKCKRLSAIFERDGSRWINTLGIQPHFIFCAPKPPANLVKNRAEHSIPSFAYNKNSPTEDDKINWMPFFSDERPNQLSCCHLQVANPGNGHLTISSRRIKG